MPKAWGENPKIVRVPRFDTSPFYRGYFGGAPEAFAPMYAEHFGTQTLGQPPVLLDGGDWRRSIVDDTHALTGTQSMKLSFNSGEPAPACGGSHYYGGRLTLPQSIPKGYWIWWRLYFYFPSTLSWGYVFEAGTDEDNACGKPADGNISAKFMVFEQSGNTSRLYQQVNVARRTVAYQPGGRILSEATGGAQAGLGGLNFPMDQWVALQFAVYVHDTDGVYRVWQDDTFLGEATGPTIDDPTWSITTAGLGDYWNGVHYTDGQAGRSDFWVDEMKVATDYPGYGAPPDTDSGGRPYIASTTRAEQTAAPETQEWGFGGFPDDTTVDALYLDDTDTLTPSEDREVTGFNLHVRASALSNDITPVVGVYDVTAGVSGASLVGSVSIPVTAGGSDQIYSATGSIALTAGRTYARALAAGGTLPTSYSYSGGQATDDNSSANDSLPASWSGTGGYSYKLPIKLTHVSV